MNSVMFTTSYAFITKFQSRHKTKFIENEKQSARLMLKARALADMF